MIWMEPSAVVALVVPSAVQVLFVGTSPPPVAAAIILSSALVVVGFLGVLVAASRIVVRIGEREVLRSVLDWEQQMEGRGLLYVPAGRQQVA
jgi:hypothetical protein